MIGQIRKPPAFISSNMQKPVVRHYDSSSSVQSARILPKSANRGWNELIYMDISRPYLKMPTLRHHYVKNTLKMLMYWHIRPTLASYVVLPPASMQSSTFSSVFALCRPRPPIFEIGSDQSFKNNSAAVVHDTPGFQFPGYSRQWLQRRWIACPATESRVCRGD